MYAENAAMVEEAQILVNTFAMFFLSNVEQHSTFSYVFARITNF